MSGFGDLHVRKSETIPDGIWVWLRGKDVIGIHNTKGDRAKLFAKFGLAIEPPLGTTSIALSPSDYDAFSSSLQGSSTHG